MRERERERVRERIRYICIHREREREREGGREGGRLRKRLKGRKEGAGGRVPEGGSAAHSVSMITAERSAVTTQAARGPLARP
jgi:hypothetical protein